MPTATPFCCRDSCLAYVIEGLSQQLTSDGGAFHVLVCSHLLGYAVGLLRVNDAIGVILGPQIPFEAQNQYWERVAFSECCAEFFDPLAAERQKLPFAVGPDSTYNPLEVDETQPLAYVIADDDEIWLE